MKELTTVTYEVDGRVARVCLNRPKQGNAITLDMAKELAETVELANLDPSVHVIALTGNGPGFCGGYDFSIAESFAAEARPESGAPTDPWVVAANHDESRPWDPVTDYQMMLRNVRGFMSLFHSEKPVLCKVQGFCVAGGTDLALCSDLVVAADDAKIGYPPARVWGVPTTALWTARLGPARAKRLLLTGDCLSGREAVEWGLATDSAPAEQLDDRFEALVQRVARLPISQLVLHKLLINQQVYANGLHATQILGTFFDGLARHTPEGYAFARRTGEVGWRAAVRERDDPFGDAGMSTYKG